MKRPAVAAVVTIALVTVFQVPASATDTVHVTEQIGVSTSVLPPEDLTKVTGTDLPATQAQREKYGCLFLAQVVVVKPGDYVYVRDTCADGRSALGLVDYVDQSNYEKYRRLCRNKSGAWSVVRCNFNWPENPPKILWAGAKNYPNGALTAVNPKLFYG